MGYLVRLLVAIIVSVALGIFSAFWFLEQIASASAVHNGAWAVNTDVGSEAAGPYTRAAIARGGLLALSKQEAIYFFAAADDAGAHLSGDCRYSISGTDIPALWWSITAYGADDYLIANDEKRFSYFRNDILDDENDFAIFASSTKMDGHWLPVASGEPFSLVLRLYHPDPAIVDDPSAFAAPSIKKEGCE